MTSSSNFFDVALFLLSSLITGPSFMSISSMVLELWQFSFIRDWPEFRKLEISPSWVFPSIWRLGRVIDTKFGTNFSNKMLLNAAKCHGYSFYRFWVIRGKLTGGLDFLMQNLMLNRLAVISNSKNEKTKSLYALF